MTGRNALAALLVATAACGSARDPSSARVTTVVLPIAARASSTADEPEPEPDPGAALQLLGTTWAGGDSDGDHYVFEFKPHGKLVYTTQTGRWDNGRWVQHDRTVAIDTNDHYADYAGVIKGDVMAGTAHNRVGRSWTWTVKKRR